MRTEIFKVEYYVICLNVRILIIISYKRMLHATSKVRYMQNLTDNPENLIMFAKNIKINRYIMGVGCYLSRRK